jgi:hypothetical protein
MSRASSQFRLSRGFAAYAGDVIVALIAIGVIAFLALDAYILFRVLASRKSAGDYGSFPVPGETTITVPAGKLKISYQESYKASSSGDTIDFGVPDALQVQVTGPSGDPLEINGPGFRGMGESLNIGSGWSRALVGTIEVADPGSYTVTASPAIEGGVEPQILLGK